MMCDITLKNYQNYFILTSTSVSYLQTDLFKDTEKSVCSEVHGFGKEFDFCIITLTYN